MAAEMVGGAFVSEGLKFLIAEAKKVKDFKPLSKELASTMERVIPLTKEIDSIQEKLDFGFGELKELMDTIERARVMVQKCQGGVSWLKRPNRTREIEEINKAMLKFCQTELQLLQYRTLSTLVGKTMSLEDTVIGLSNRMDHFIVPPPVFTDLCSVPKLDFVPVGLDWPLMELKKKLLDDDVVNLVVSAPPGCGKTTLVTQLCHNEEIKGKFTNIFFNVVSSAPNFRGIVQNLRQHNNEAPHTFENDSHAKDSLRKLLKKLREKGPVLLVLDDVWYGAESFLENFRITIPDYKILVTSRVDFPDLGYVYQLKPLKDEYAKTLLVECASQPDHASPAEYEYLLQKILKRCNGFPIVIKVVGGSLKNRSLIQWQGQVLSWFKGGTILDNPRPTVLDCLKPSFDALDFKLKHCFLDMGSFLEDQKIRASIIIDIWAELYGHGMTEKEKIILCMKYLEDLAAHNLLDLVPLGKKEHENGFFYNEFLVTQHDILRELAICQSKSEENLERNRKRLNLEIKGDKFPEWCLDPMQSINARLLSISTDDSFSSTWFKMDCPNVEALVLNISSLDYALPSFIATMKKLKVLTIKNHGFFPAILSNFSCLSSLPNLKRIRLEKGSIALLDLPRLRLGSLEKLSLVMCSFGEIFYDCMEEIDISEALPNLQEIDIDCCYDLDELPYWITEEAVSLKTVSITNCNKLTTLPEAIGNLSELQVLRLSSCISLSEHA